MRYAPISENSDSRFISVFFFENVYAEFTAFRKRYVRPGLRAPSDTSIRPAG